MAGGMSSSDSASVTVGAGLADGCGDLLVGVAVLLDQGAVALGLLERR